MTPFTKKKDLKNNWYLVNAENLVVGRLAAYISKVLRGKNKAKYDPITHKCSLPSAKRGRSENCVDFGIYQIN